MLDGSIITTSLTQSHEAAKAKEQVAIVSTSAANSSMELDTVPAAPASAPAVANPTSKHEAPASPSTLASSEIEAAPSTSDRREPGVVARAKSPPPSGDLATYLKRKVWTIAPNVIDEQQSLRRAMTGNPNKMNMQERAAAALAEIAHDNPDMQDAIIDASGVPPLLNFIRIGSLNGQEHAARAIWHLADIDDNHRVLVDSGAISDLVALLKNGSPKAQEAAAAGIAALARGGIAELRSAAAANEERKTIQRGESHTSKDTLGIVAESEKVEPDEDDDDELASGNRLVAIADAGGIERLVALLNTGTIVARENAASALWHLAFVSSNQVLARL